MHKRIWSKQSVITWMILALLALGSGQALGIFMTHEITPPPLEKTAAEPLIFTGEVILEKIPVPAPASGLWTQVAPEGKVYGGQTLFSGPVSTARVAQRLRLYSQGFAAKDMAIPARREALHRAIGALSGKNGDMVEVMALICQPPTEAPLTQTRQQLALLSARSQEITAEVGGIFIPGGEDDALGYIITDRTWKLALQLPFPVTEGQKIRAQLLNGIFRWAEFTVEQATWKNQSCQVLLSCKEDVAAVGKIRNLTVKISPE